ncbi:MAG: hypothetical protein ABW092_16905 [Candidatus Thiodiazotropha sp.]
MIIDLIIWQSICKKQINAAPQNQGLRKHSAEEEGAFKRSLARHRGRHYIRFS